MILPENVKILDAACDNVLAWRLAEALNEAMAAKAGDPIDRGLALLRTLKAKGFGVVQLPSETHR